MRAGHTHLGMSGKPGQQTSELEHVNRLAASCDHVTRLFRRSIIPRALTWKRRQQPSSRASMLLTGYFSAFNTHNKCTGVCRLVCGILVGIGRRVVSGGVSVGLRSDVPCWPIMVC